MNTITINIKTFIRQGSGYAFSDGIYAEFTTYDEYGSHDRYEPIDVSNLEAEVERLRDQFGEVHDLRLERLVTEE